MSWVISLGAGREQLPIIRAIQHEGHKCLAFDQDEQAPGKDLADAFYSISNRNVDRICETAGWVSDIAGVVAAASEVPDVMATVAHRLGLPGIPVATGFLLKDKLLYKKVLKAAGVPHTEAHATYAGGIKAAFDELGYEVVVKPQRGSGSRGVSIVRHAPMQLDIAYADAEAVCYEVIVERYEPGPQISSETIIWDGVARTVGFVDRFYDEGSLVERGGCMPSVHDGERKRCNDIIASAASALGIRRGTLKCDLVLSKDGPKIIECTARLSGGPLSKIVKESSGVDYLRQAVRVACGVEPDWIALSPTKSAYVSVDMNGGLLLWSI